MDVTFEKYTHQERELFAWHRWLYEYATEGQPWKKAAAWRLIRDVFK